MVFMSVLRGFVNTSTTIKDLDNRIPYSWINMNAFKDATRGHWLSVNTCVIRIRRMWQWWR